MHFSPMVDPLSFEDEGAPGEGVKCHMKVLSFVRANF